MPILCSIFPLQIFYWYFSSGPRGALRSIYKKFRVQGLTNFWRVVYIESVLILFFFEPDTISNLLQETQTVLCYFIFNNFNHKGFFKKSDLILLQKIVLYFLGNFQLILIFSLFEQTITAPQPSATWRLIQGCSTPLAPRGKRGALTLRTWMILTSMPPPP